MDDGLLRVALPLVLAIMMMTMGLGLTLNDFKQVILRPKAFFTGVTNQVILLPIATFLVATVSDLDPLLAAGFMLLAACPGGVTSNIITHFAKGDTALSVSMTAVVSLAGFITIPIIVAFGLNHFAGESADIAVPVDLIAGAVFVITIIPVAIGMLLKRFATRFAEVAEPWFNRLSALFFVLIVIGAVAANWQLFVDNVAEIGAAVLILNVVMMAIGYYSSKFLSLSDKQAVSISIETGIQNSTIGITLAISVLDNQVLSLPAAVYGILMYGPAFLLVSKLRRKFATENSA